VAETFEQAAKRVEAGGDANADVFLAEDRGRHDNKEVQTVEKQHIETV
jgi:hypothetical protein